MDNKSQTSENSAAILDAFKIHLEINKTTSETEKAEKKKQIEKILKRVHC